MRSTKPNVFRVGELYTHEEIYSRLQVGNAGGIRPSLGKNGDVRRVVVMTSLPSAKILKENPYHDRVEGDVLVYTAAGLEGRQEFSGINRRLLEQRQSAYPIYGFSNVGNRRDKQLGRRRWKFLGLLRYLRHFLEKQVDVRGEQRHTVVFELHICNDPHDVPVEHERELSASICSNPLDLNTCDESERELETRNVGVFKRVVDGTVAENTRLALLSLTPLRFEHMVKFALEKTGFERVTVTRYTSDGGIDVNAIASDELWPFKGALLQIQAKRWLHTVGRREVAELRGSLQPNANGAIVTTSFYSKSATLESVDGIKKPIVLINGLDFASILVRNQCDLAEGVGSKQQIKT